MATVTAEQFATLKQKVCEHEIWIDGNGKEGAKTRLKTVEDATRAIEKKIDRMTGWLAGLIASVLGSILIWMITNLLSGG